MSASGFSPMSTAIAGSDVVITVESMFSMNSAQATMSGMRKARCKRRSGDGGHELTRRPRAEERENYMVKFRNAVRGTTPPAHFDRSCVSTIGDAVVDFRIAIGWLVF